MTALLEIKDLYTGYNGVPVVRDLNLHVDEGEVVALLGPNGAGKTTTLLTTSAPRARSSPATSRSSAARSRAGGPHLIARDGLAHVPEDRSLFFQLTVRGEPAARRGQGLGRHRPGARRTSPRSSRIHDPPGRPALGRRAADARHGPRADRPTPKLLMVDEMSLGLAPIIVERLLPVLRQHRRRDRRGRAARRAARPPRARRSPTGPTCCRTANLALEGSAAELSENRHLLESSYMGQSEIAAAEEEQEEIEQQLEPSGAPDPADTPPPPPPTAPPG